MAHQIGLRELLAWIPRLEVVVTSVCPLCLLAAQNGGLCEPCYSELTTQRASGQRCSCCALQLTAQGICVDCAARKPAYQQVYAAFDLQPPADLLLHLYKAKHTLSLVRVLVQAMDEHIKRHPQHLPSNVWVLSIPSRSPTLKKRGFNPAGELARGLAKRLGYPYKVGHLYYKEPLFLGAQKNRSRQERLDADFSAWACKEIPPHTHILLVDDVLTTGSTLHHASLLCLAAGAASVQVAVAARTPWRELLLTAP